MRTAKCYVRPREGRMMIQVIHLYNPSVAYTFNVCLSVSVCLSVCLLWVRVLECVSCPSISLPFYVSPMSTCTHSRPYSVFIVITPPPSSSRYVMLAPINTQYHTLSTTVHHLIECHPHLYYTINPTVTGQTPTLQQMTSLRKCLRTRARVCVCVCTCRTPLWRRPWHFQMAFPNVGGLKHRFDWQVKLMFQIACAN